MMAFLMRSLAYQKLHLRVKQCLPIGSLRSLASTATTSARPDGVKSLSEMPGPPSIPVLGSVWKLLLDSRKKSLGKVLLESQFADVQTYGKIYKTKLPGKNIVQVADPDATREVFRNDPKYPKRFDIPHLDHYRETRKAIPGVFFADGPDWYKHRSVISKRILKPREVAEYSPVFNEIITDFLARLGTLRGPSGSEFENEVQNMDKELFKWSFESVAHMLFERRFGCLEEQVNREAQEFIKAVGGFLAVVVPAGFLPVWFYKIYETKTYKEFVYHFDTMYRYAELFTGRKLQELERQGKLGTEVGEEEEKVDFFRFLLSSGKITKDDLIASVIDLLFAGVDTTSNTMQWVLYMMGKNPEKQDKLYREVSSLLKPGEYPTAQNISKMSYLKAWLKETLRLYPVLAVLSRQLPKDIVLLGYNIPAGVNINMLVYYMARDESIFKDANQFNPERWLRDEKHNMAEEIHAFASIPFGFGTRMCVGRRIAELELHLLMARVVQQYIIEYPHQDDVEPFMRGVTIPDRPVRVKFVDRIMN